MPPTRRRSAGAAPPHVLVRLPGPYVKLLLAGAWTSFVLPNDVGPRGRNAGNARKMTFDPRYTGRAVDFRKRQDDPPFHGLGDQCLCCRCGRRCAPRCAASLRGSSSCSTLGSTASRPPRSRRRHSLHRRSADCSTALPPTMRRCAARRRGAAPRRRPAAPKRKQTHHCERGGPGSAVAPHRGTWAPSGQVGRAARGAEHCTRRVGHVRDMPRRPRRGAT